MSLVTLPCDLATNRSWHSDFMSIFIIQRDFYES